MIAVKKVNWLREYSLVAILVGALISSIFFDDPHLYFYKRVVYGLFLYFVLYQLFLFNYGTTDSRKKLVIPTFYRNYIRIFFIFIAYETVIDFFSPTFNLVTLLNHPLSVMAVVPVFAFKIGYQTLDTKKVYKILFYISVAFMVFLAFPIKGNNVYNASIACYSAVLPFLAFSLIKKEHRVYAVILVGLGFLLSDVSDSRTVMLRIMLFCGLYMSLSAVKNFSFLKLLILLAVAFFIYEVLTNLQNVLDMIVTDTGAKKFDDADTRTFLYQELFDDMKVKELFLGRGFQGLYFSPYFLDQMRQGITNGDSYTRFSVEVGFLELILKGGFVYYFLYITPLVISCYKGIFTTNVNRLSFSLSIVILTDLYVMFLENIPAFTFQCFLLFFLAGFSLRRVDMKIPRANPI